MSNFKKHTVESAPQASKEILAATVATYGHVPNVLGTIASVPVLLQGYTELANLYKESHLTDEEHYIILMSNDAVNGCHYCMAANTTFAQMAKVSIGIIEALRTGASLADPKLEALRRFAINFNEARGKPSSEQVEAFLAAGYRKETILLIIMGYTLSTLISLSEYFTQPDLDELYVPNAWSEDMSPEEQQKHREYAEKHYLSVDFWRGRDG